jgi:allantoin racemase
MPRILILNPNTSESATRYMEEECRKIAAPGTEILAANPKAKEGCNIPTILSYVDSAICAVETIKVAWEERNSYDGVIVAGFSDPGLDALKEILDKPALGIGEAAYHAASMLGHRFSVLTTTPKWTPPKEDYIKTVGLESKVASIVAHGGFEEELPNFKTGSTEWKEVLTKRFVSAAKIAIEQDGAEAIILGGGSYIGFADRLQRELGAPVIEPTAVALKYMEGFLRLGLVQSKVCKWKKPIERLGPYEYDRDLR